MCFNSSHHSFPLIHRWTVSACWKNLVSEVVNDFKGFPGITEEVRKTIHGARQVGGGFSDMLDEEVEENREVHQQVLTNE